jgi:pyruvate,water dikinase
VLGQHAARHRTITTELADAVAALGPDAGPNELASFLDRFGHRGVYESDIARPRYRDEPDLLMAETPMAETVGGDRRRQRPPQRTVIGLLATPIWLAAKGPLAAREQWRHDAMAAFEVLRNELIRHGERAVRQGRLPEVAALWDLTVQEARRLDHGWVVDEAFMAERRAERDRLAAIAVPMTVSSGDDPASWSTGSMPTDGLRGLPLTSGTVDGVAWVLNEPAGPEDRPSTDQPVVLVARSIDAGWITTMAGCDAVVVEIGGDLSHGSILVRELGLPAVTNVAGARAAFDTGDAIRVDASSGSVERPASVAT